MSAEINAVVERKLALLDTQVARLRFHLRDVTKARFVDDWVLRSMAERALQVAGEIMIDVAERIIATRGAGPVASASEAIKRLVQLGVLESAQPYADIVRFRNLIVHRYEEIDPDVLFELVTNRLGDFARFRDEIDTASRSAA
jgi:uncharacterized protein YutE (UPF0331/DUF86 family)